MQEKAIAVPYSALAYSSAAARYLDRNDHYLTEADVRVIIDADIEARRLQVLSLALKLKTEADRLAAGQISAEQFSAELVAANDTMVVLVKELYLAHGAAGSGGFATMNATDQATLQRHLRFGCQALRGIAAQVEKQPSLAEIQWLVGQWLGLVLNARYEFESLRLLAEVGAGYRFEENLLDEDARHCYEGFTDRLSCPEETQRGVVPIGRISLPGERHCGWGCRCLIVRYLWHPPGRS